MHNSTGGILTQALLARLWKREAKPNEGLPADLREYFSLVAEENSLSAKLGRIFLASRLFWLYQLDQRWSSEKIINRMRWQGEENSESVGLWEGYLWTPRLNASLLKELEIPLSEAIAHHPEAILMFLDAIFDKNGGDSWALRSLNEILLKIKLVQPELAQVTRYKTLYDLSLRG